MFWTAVAIASGLYAVMLIWSLPIISADAGGLPPFDMRPGGHTFEEAKTFLGMLSDEGNVFYRNIQQRLDIAFPFFQSLATGWAIYRLSPARLGKWRAGLALPGVPGMVLDTVEKPMGGLLEPGEQGLTPHMVARARFYSQMKAAVITAVSLILPFYTRHVAGPPTPRLTTRLGSSFTTTLQSSHYIKLRRGPLLQK